MLTGILNNIRKTMVVDVTCQRCGESFGVEFSQAIRNDGTKIRGVSAIPRRSQRDPNCNYCKHKFAEKKE